MIDLELIGGLVRSVGGDEQRVSIARSLNDAEMDVLRSEAPISVLWVYRDKDQIFTYWKLLKEGLLASKCAVIFSNAREDERWGDLTRDYEGVKFGSTFLMVCDNANTHPNLVPSQKGLFRGEEK